MIYEKEKVFNIFYQGYTWVQQVNKYNLACKLP